MAADGLGQLTALVIADISRRRADQTGYAECFSMYSLMSIRTMFFSSSNSACASALASSVLPTPVGPRNRKRAERTVRVLDARTGAQDGLAHALDGFVLPDDALMQRVLQVQQLLALALHQLRDRDARPAADDSGDFLLRHLVAQQAVLAPSVFSAIFFRRQLLLQLAAARRTSVRRPCSGRIAARPRSISAFMRSISSRSFCTLPMAFFLVFPAAPSCALNCVAQLGQLLLNLCQTLPWRASSSPSSAPLPQSPCCMMRRSHVVQLCGHGIDFGADQWHRPHPPRSMALSGRKRSVI